MTELVASSHILRPPGLVRTSRLGAAAFALVLVSLGLVDAFNSAQVSSGLALAGGLVLTGFLLLAIRHFDTAVAIGLLLMGIVRFEPAPTDIAFAVIMTLAAITGRFRLARAPLLLRWIVAVLLVLNLLSVMEVVSFSAAIRFLFITVYLATFAVWLAAYVDSPRRARRVVVTWLWIAVASAALASLALHVPIPGHQLLTGSVDEGDRASGLFKDPNVFGPWLIPIAVILLEGHISPKVPRLLRLRAGSTWLCLLALTRGVLFSYSPAAWPNLVIP